MVSDDSGASTSDEPQESQEDKHHSTLSVASALVGNSLIACAKTFAYFYSGGLGQAPFAMFAEAGHSWGDTASQGSLLYGIFRGRKKADKIFSFGYGKERFFWSLVSAAIVLGLGGVMVGQAIHGFAKETAPHLSAVSVIVFIVAAVIESSTLTIAVRGVWKAKRGMSLIYYLKHTSDPSGVAVLLEDSVAVVGIVIALGGIGLTKWTGNPLYDTLASLLIGILMIGMAVVLGNMNRMLLLGRSSPETERKIREILSRNPYVQEVHLIKTMVIGAEQVFAHVEIDLKEEEVVKRLNGGTKRHITQISSHQDLKKVLEIIRSVKDGIEVEIWRLPEVTQLVLKEAHFGAQEGEVRVSDSPS